MTEKPGSESRRRGLEEIPVRSLHVDFDGSGRGGPDIDKHLRKLSSFPSPSALEKAEPRLLLSGKAVSFLVFLLKRQELVEQQHREQYTEELFH